MRLYERNGRHKHTAMRIVHAIRMITSGAVRSACELQRALHAQRHVHRVRNNTQSANTEQVAQTAAQRPDDGRKRHRALQITNRPTHKTTHDACTHQNSVPGVIRLRAAGGRMHCHPAATFTPLRPLRYAVCTDAITMNATSTTAATTAAIDLFCSIHV